ncbi:MAG: DUF2950 domain-containing protein [Desulfobacterales bacterium]|jgi:hypothetical protein|nr:DUF2950 domain-containing protein [Desulfobacterales bacterium]
MSRSHNNQRIVRRRASGLFFAALAVVFFCGSFGHHAAAAQQKQFATAEAAVEALVAALKENNEKQLLAIFGDAAKELIASGDPVGDRNRRELFTKAYEQKNFLAPEGAKMVLVVGEKEWPFPVPLAKKGDRWFFDTLAGKAEILNRRIGENELSTVQTLLAIVDAQREYAMKDRNNNGVREYAQKFRSDPGQQNGLFWKAKPGEEPSPLGELVADARSEGYAQPATTAGPVPFHGYYFRMLTKQGKNAPGGAFDYVVRNKMVGGFAVVAYPAVYGSSGVMTFAVNHDGVVFEKDLGKETAKAAQAIQAFDPDKAWKRVE